MTRLNRRKFLKAASAGVGTVALGPDRLFAGQQSLTSPSAEIVVVGAGAFGGWTALYLREMGTTMDPHYRQGPPPTHSNVNADGAIHSHNLMTSPRVT